MSRRKLRPRRDKRKKRAEITMLFWLTAIGGFVLLASVAGAGLYFRLNQNLITGTCMVIIMASVWLSLLAKREEIRTQPALSQSAK